MSAYLSDVAKSVVRAEAGLKIRTDRGCLARSNELSPPREPALAPEDRIKSLSGPNRKIREGRVAGGRKRKRAQGRRKDREKEIGKGKQEEELGGEREREKRRERFREYYFVMCVVSDNTYHIYNIHTTLANVSLD